MLYTVEELSTRFNVSKVTIYDKIKLPHIQPYVIKKDGKKQIKEEALSLIEESLKIKIDSDVTADAQDEVAATVLNLSENLIESLNSQIDFLKLQILEKDKQIERGDKHLENMQVLLKQEQYNLSKTLDQQKHFDAVDTFLVNAVRNKVKVSEVPKKQNIFKRIFKR